MTSGITTTSIPSVQTFLAVQSCSIDLNALIVDIKETTNPQWNRLYPQLLFLSSKIDELAKKNIESIQKLVSKMQKKVQTSCSLLERRCIERLSYELQHPAKPVDQLNRIECLVDVALSSELQHPTKLVDQLNRPEFLADVALSSELQHPAKLVDQLKTLESLADAINPATLQDMFLKVASLDAVIDFDGVYMSICNRIYSMNKSKTFTSASRLKLILAYAFKESVIHGMMSWINLKGAEYAETAFEDFFYHNDGSSSALGKGYFNQKCTYLMHYLKKQYSGETLKKEMALRALKAMSDTLKAKKSRFF